MQALAQLGWDSILPSLCSGVFALAGVCLGYLLQRLQACHDRRKDTRYRLLDILRQLQVVIATAVDRAKKECDSGSNPRERYNDMVLKLALGETTRPLQDAVLDTLQKHDSLPELKEVRRALWCPGSDGKRWLALLAKAVEALEVRVSPKLKACDEELYGELPEDIRRIIEHPE
jgi:hypothetical protein